MFLTAKTLCQAHGCSSQLSASYLRHKHLWDYLMTRSRACSIWCDKNQRLRNAINTDAQSCRLCRHISHTRNQKIRRRRHPQSISRTDRAANRTFVRLGRASADAEATLAWENSIGERGFGMHAEWDGLSWNWCELQRQRERKTLSSATSRIVSSSICKLRGLIYWQPEIHGGSDSDVVMIRKRT